VAEVLSPEPTVRVGKVMFFHAGFPGSTLYVDGENRGALPATIEQLPEGRHSFRIVDLVTGEETVLSREIALKKSGGGATIVQLDRP
jgi:hypothetical protein